MPPKNTNIRGYRAIILHTAGVSLGLSRWQKNVDRRCLKIGRGGRKIGPKSEEIMPKKSQRRSALMVFLEFPKIYIMIIKKMR